MEACWAREFRSASSIASIWSEMAFASAAAFAFWLREEPGRLGLGGMAPAEDGAERC
jgi:hypothetical protein